MFTHGNHMGNGPCTAGFSFAFGFDGNADFIAVIALWSSLFWVNLQRIEQFGKFFFKGFEFTGEPPGLPVEIGDGFNAIAHLTGLWRRGLSTYLY